MIRLSDNISALSILAIASSKAVWPFCMCTIKPSGDCGIAGQDTCVSACLLVGYAACFHKRSELRSTSRRPSRPRAVTRRTKFHIPLCSTVIGEPHAMKCTKYEYYLVLRPSHDATTLNRAVDCCKMYSLVSH